MTGAPGSPSASGTSPPGKQWLEERARIARELHDVIAHNVSMMVLQAGAERAVLDGANGETRNVLHTIEQDGRSALTEMRRLLGMLRSDAADPLTPQPRLADLPTLISQVRHVRYGTDTLELEITDDGAGTALPAAGSGHGLAGIRERVALYGGRLDAGHRPAGGFGVRVLVGGQDRGSAAAPGRSSACLISRVDLVGGTGIEPVISSVSGTAARLPEAAEKARCDFQPNDVRRAMRAGAW